MITLKDDDIKTSNKILSTDHQLIKWLLEGDVSIQYQVYRDLLNIERTDLRDRISVEGWGADFLSFRKPNGHWGHSFYQPKWISTHYTLLDLRCLSIAPSNLLIKKSIENVLLNEKANDGGVNHSIPSSKSDVCVNGMFLNYASYFKSDEKSLESVVDFILSQHMMDGGFNCRSNRSQCKHSSLHTTLSILEGITEYEKNGYSYRLQELIEAVNLSKEFVLIHKLFLSDRTGKIIHRNFLKLSYPRRWRYDILSAMDYFQYSETPWDDRMTSAINVLLKKRKKDLTWNVQASHPGKTHINMEQAGLSSRWNTLRALRVLKYYNRM